MTFTRIALLAAVAAMGCNESADLSTRTSAVAGQIPSQLRGYDLGPPFPAGFRDSGLVNGYAEGEWVPFVAMMSGKKLADADQLAGGVGDGRYGLAIILPTYSPRHDANSISDFLTSGTYGQGALTPIPDPFDDQWLIDNGYSPFVLGAYADTGDVDLAPAIDLAAQRSGPTRFGGQVGSVSVPIEFRVPASATVVELRFAVRLAPPQLQPIEPNGQKFPGTLAGTAKGAADFFPGPGPIFVGYEVDRPTGIATVPIRVERHSCASDEECPPGETCTEGGTCEEPCTDDSSCPSEQVCEDGTCQDPPPPCETTTDCEGNTTCIGGHCVPECPVDGGGDPVVCNPGDGEPPCVRDSQCNGNNVCEDGVCQPCDHPCDVSCRPGLVCVEGWCEEPVEECHGGNCPATVTCASQYDCAGGQLCENGVCTDGGGNVETCSSDADCTTGACIGGVCSASPTRLLTCDASTVCPAGHDCTNGRCERRAGICELDGDCTDGDACLNGWCGRACSADGDCDGGELCVSDRCVAACATASNCAFGEACLSGGCVPELALIGHAGGDQSLWEVGFAETDDNGGCAVGSSGSGASMLLLVGLALLRRRRR